MKFQCQQSTGRWSDESRMDFFIKLALALEPTMAKFEKRTPLTSAEQVKAYLATGKTLRYDTEWYAYIRDADAQPKPRPTVQDYPQGRKLNCGHTVYMASHVMSASRGSSCPDCYDRMSD